jgi:hypothetical protein
VSQPLTDHIRLGRRTPPRTAPHGARIWYYTYLNKLGRSIFRGYESTLKTEALKVYITYEPSGDVLVLNSYRKEQPLVRLGPNAALAYLQQAAGEAGNVDMLECAVINARTAGREFYLKEAT